MNEQVLLTISLLISNRPDTVEKCLQSLDSLRKNVPCELILTDTGCGEQVRSIIEGYADRILEFEWCRDFAKARNLGLDAARGEWFLYLDDDEWFEDTKEIEDFFNSGLYKQYGAVLYLQRNYSNLNGTLYSDATVSRMVRLGNGVRMQYSIHETFTKVNGPAKLLHSFVHHYGYIYKNKSESYKHSQRNLIPLLEEHEKAPHNLRHNAQLAQEYNGIGEYLKSIEISLKGIEDYKKGESADGNLNSLFVNVVEGYLKMYRYEEALSHAEEYMADDRINRLGMAKICMLISKATHELEQYEKCVKFCDLYMKIYADYCTNEDWYTTRSGLFMNNAFEEKPRYETICIGVSANMKLKKYKDAYDLFKRIDLERKILVLDLELIKSVVETFLFEKMSKEHPCVCMMNQLLERKQLQPAIVEELEKVREKNPKVVEDDVDKWNYIQEECWFVYYLRLKADNGEDNDNKECWKKLWATPEKVLPKALTLGIWEMAEHIGIRMDCFIEDIPYYKWTTAVVAACSLLSADELEKLNCLIDKEGGKEAPNRKSWKLYYVQKRLERLEDENEISRENMVDMLDAFSQLTIELAEMVYNASALAEHREWLPAGIQAAFVIKEMLACTKNGQYAAAIQKIREVKDLVPAFSVPLKVYTVWLDCLVKEEQQERDKEKKEMQLLAEKIKERIRFLLNQQMYEEAEAILLQLTTMLPEDKELQSWEAEIQQKKIICKISNRTKETKKYSDK